MRDPYPSKDRPSFAPKILLFYISIIRRILSSRRNFNIDRSRCSTLLLSNRRNNDSEKFLLVCGTHRVGEVDAIKRSRQWTARMRNALKYEARRYYRLRSRNYAQNDPFFSYSCFASFLFPPFYFPFSFLLSSFRALIFPQRCSPRAPSFLVASVFIL